MGDDSQSWEPGSQPAGSVKTGRRVSSPGGSFYTSSNSDIFKNAGILVSLRNTEMGTEDMNGLVVKSI